MEHLYSASQRFRGAPDPIQCYHASKQDSLHTFPRKGRFDA